MTTTASKDQTRSQKLLRLLHIAHWTLREYRAFRRFTSLSDAEQTQHLEIPSHFAQSLLNLGPLFIKAGQILSTRPDILPSAYITALALLQEHVPSTPFGQIKTTVEEEFGADLGALFSSFSDIPVASASLAQVHFAVLNDGTPVAVKVQHSLVSSQIAADLTLIAGLLRIIKHILPGPLRRLNIVTGFDEFKRYTLQELDYTIEATTMERFTHNFASWPDIVIPRVYRDRVRSRVLTMERVDGQRLADFVLTLSETERLRLGRRLLEMEMKMFIADGVFHADLHPGNIFFTAAGKIVLLDFGMYGELSETHRDHFMLYWYAGLQRQTQRAFHHLMKQTTRLKGANEEAYYRAFKVAADQFYTSTISEKSLTQTYLAVILNGARFGFVFPSDLLLEAKALTTAESLTLTLAPHMKFEQEMLPIMGREFMQRVVDVKRLKVLAERVLPELLLLGELPPPFPDDPVENTSSLPIDWSAALAALGAQIALFKPYLDLTMLCFMLDPHAHTVLEREYSLIEVDEILDQTWTNFVAGAREIPPQETVGATITVQLASLTIALYHALVGKGQSPDAATSLIYDVSWLVYKRMGAAPWVMAGAVTDNGRDKLLIATAAFRRFPFSAPSYGWRDVKTVAGVVAFDCLKCPVAELFRHQNLADLCVNTWCKLDFPLAQQWDSTLHRTGTIAGGAPVCDFRWHANSGTDDTR